MIFNPNEFEFVATRAWVANRIVFMELNATLGSFQAPLPLAA